MLYVAEREELGLDMGIEQIVVNPVKGRHREPEHLARNPFGTLPVLELEDGSYIVESLAIIEYLEDKYPEDGLLAGSPEQRGKARTSSASSICALPAPWAGTSTPPDRLSGCRPIPNGRPSWRPICRRRSTTSSSCSPTAAAAAGRARDDRRLHAAGVAPVPARLSRRSVRRAAAAARLGRRYRARPAAQKVLRW